MARNRASASAAVVNSRRLGRNRFAGYRYIGPAAIIMAALIIYPMFYGLYLSFFNTNLVSKW